jgi:uncharacterized protein (DUF952 family)
VIDRPIHHVALAADWAAARVSGEYRVSTLGATLDDVGFIHAAFVEQVAGVLDRFYGGVDDPLVVLVIDPARLTAPVRVEVPAGAHEAFPHVYGPVPAAAVTDVLDVGRNGVGRLRVVGLAP